MKRRQQGHDITGAFVFMLLGIFAVMSTVLVLFGVRAYRSSIERSDLNNEERLLSFYLRSMMRNVDEENRIGVETIGGTDTLYYTESYDGEEYVTRIYSWDGMLREWFSERSRPFEPGEGEILFEADSFEAELDGGLLTAVIRGRPDDEAKTLNIAIYGEMGRENRPGEEEA